MMAVLSIVVAVLSVSEGHVNTIPSIDTTCLPDQSQPLYAQPRTRAVLSVVPEPFFEPSNRGAGSHGDSEERILIFIGLYRW